MAYDPLDALLRMALIVEYVSDKKEQKKRLIKLSKRSTPSVREAMINKVIDATGRKEMVYFLCEGLLDLYACSTEISKMGYPGFVIYKGEAIPLDIKLRDPKVAAMEDDKKRSYFYHREQTVEDRKWIIANEHEMVAAAAHSLMNFLNIERVACEVVLFKTRGFSGTRQSIEVERGVAGKLNKRIGNSNYYF